MAKTIENSFEVRTIIRMCPTEGPCVESAKLCYNVVCEHGMAEARMLLLQHSDKLRDAVKDLGEEVTTQVDTHEQIAEMDSLLYSPPA